jgi:hypothetical protein
VETPDPRPRVYIYICTYIGREGKRERERERERETERQREGERPAVVGAEFNDEALWGAVQLRHGHPRCTFLPLHLPKY